ncbi:helix-turn-helix transcriptional regulator [Streptomyces purpurascens]|uniref:helix-turn-helix transcriptional regulator n=1 Tax=Streptomyces purpurascens TaxID=1924 RepID=UPI001674743B|nr:hypothetical protein [Streptomyces purpurascens]MCE7049536.1 hypothetical protein [Streptomyces purpurascens]
MGKHPLNGNDARAILKITFAWIERSGPAADPGELERELREAGYGPPQTIHPDRPRRLSRTEREGLAPLTIRLADILELSGYGWTPEQIGKEHSLTAGTVKEYLRDARRRLGVGTLEEAVAEAARRELIDLSGPRPEPGV